MARKLISVLGTGNYKECIYEFNNEKVKSIYIQEAILDMFCKKWSEEDSIIVLTTKKSEETHWNNPVCNHRDLKSILEEKKLKSKNIFIPDGKNEEELWEIYEKIFDAIEEEDEIIFDITHSFRFIPMLVLVVLSYAKVIKNIKITGIFYGAYEARKVVEEEEIAPIFDLTTFNELLDWTQAVGSFINHGNSKEIDDLYNQIRKEKNKSGDRSTNNLFSIINGLSDLTNNIYTCRGKILSEGEKIERNTSKKSIYYGYKMLKEGLESIDLEKDTTIKPLKPLFKKVQEKVSIFDTKDNLELGLATVKWSIENGLIQQAYTALDETIKTYVCKQFGIKDNDYKKREEIVSKAIRIKSTKKVENQWRIAEEYRNEIKHIVENLDEEIALISGSLLEKRNDINHFAMRENVAPYDKLNSEIVNLYERFLEVVYK